MFDPNEELRMLRDTIARAAREKIAPLAGSIDRTGAFDREVEALCWDLGLLTMTLPPEFGGVTDLRGTALCCAVEEIAKHCASSALLLIIQAVGSFPIVHGARDEIRSRFLSRIADEKLLVAYLVTEPSAGSDVAGIRTTARKDHEMFRDQRRGGILVLGSGSHFRPGRTWRPLLFPGGTGRAGPSHRPNRG